MWPLLGEQDLAELQVTTEYIAVVLHDKKSKSVMIVTEHSYCIHIQREIGKTNDVLTVLLIINMQKFVCLWFYNAVTTEPIWMVLGLVVY